uniref:Glycoside hydrolase family 1 n=1 Tax=Phyllotreta striolata TaxID=444603 RepID=A0A059UAE3_PHYSR|nr:glycoside hydrolase family 1 [Phyllotreta striolata]
MQFIVIALILQVCLGQDINDNSFPDDFMFGTATAAFQIEGAWNEDGKSPSNWDVDIHNNNSIVADGNNADIACDSYHKYKEDVAMMKAMNMNHYRFSIAWTRILPNGYGGEVNQKGINYYKNLIKELQLNDIQPFVTIFHWDLPQTLQDYGGLLNDSFVDWFSEYSTVLFRHFGDDVKWWITFNEPQSVCSGGYGAGIVPPLIKSPAIGEYQCVHNLIKAHAKAWRIYDQQFRKTQKGKVSISLNTHSHLPATDSKENRTAAETQQLFQLGIYANPIYLGDYPEIVKTRIAARSKAEGRSQSRLPAFTRDEIDFIRGTYDFFALNVYSAYLVNSIAEPPVTDPPSNWADIGVNTYQPDDWEKTSAEHIKVVPWTIRPLLNWIASHYNNPGIVITENGYPSWNGDKDDRRLYYIKNYLSYIRTTMEEDGVKVLGYTVWTLLDNFEWTSGFTQKFGLYKVDFKTLKRTRTPRPSSIFYGKVSKTRCLVEKCK